MVFSTVKFSKQLSSFVRGLLGRVAPLHKKVVDKGENVKTKFQFKEEGEVVKVTCLVGDEPTGGFSVPKEEAEALYSAVARHFEAER